MNHRVIEVTPDNIADVGVLCARAGQYAGGAEEKAQWYRQRYGEGLRMLLSVDETGEKTGMIEYVPGEYAWRTIEARGYVVIHCLQVLRNHTRRGFGELLLGECMRDAAGTAGVAIVTSSKPWVNDKRFFLKNGFRQVEKAPPYFELLVKQFRDGPLPSFHTGWEERAARYGAGVTVLYADQCPVVDFAVSDALDAARECHLEARLQKIQSAAEAQAAPSPYGTFQILLDGKFITHRIFDRQRYVALFKGARPGREEE